MGDDGEVAPAFLVYSFPFFFSFLNATLILSKPNENIDP